MNLTRRQQEFIRNLLDLYRETKGPIHYTTLAERVGVSQITAYDMLRLLEKKGFVRSDYQLALDKTGPGGSTVVFWPSQQAHQRFAEIFQELGGHDWETLRERFLEQISCEIPRSESDRRFGGGDLRLCFAGRPRFTPILRGDRDRDHAAATA